MGGDLNLKKSWHPVLMKNQQKVWEEEKKALDERKKTEQMIKERKEERAKEDLERMAESAGGKKRVDRVDWMYAGPTAGAQGTTEEMEGYLLGKRRVDGLLKGTESQKLEKNASQETFMALQNANTALDTAAKVREDPLLAIKRQEQAAYERMMNDPSQRRQMLKAAGVEPSKDVSKSREKDRKHRRHHRDDDGQRREKRSRRDDDHRHSRSHRRHHHRRRSESYSDSRSRSRSPRRLHKSVSLEDNYSGSQRNPDSRLSRGDSYRSRSPRRDKYSDRNRGRDSPSRRGDRRPTPPTRRERSFSPIIRKNTSSRSPTPPRHSYSAPRKQNGWDNSRRDSRPDSRRPDNGTGNVDREADRARKLAAMQADATELDTEREQRLVALRKKEEADLEAENAARQKSSKYGSKGDFVMGLNRKAGDLDLGERISRGRQGLKVERDDV
jgi:Pre-mRNA splicing factor/N-terminal domain of CBF1 interacting co-repressor CIR